MKFFFAMSVARHISKQSYTYFFPILAWCRNLQYKIRTYYYNLFSLCRSRFVAHDFGYRAKRREEGRRGTAIKKGVTRSGSLKKKGSNFLISAQVLRFLSTMQKNEEG